MADLAALQAQLETFGGLAARLKQHRVAVGVAAGLLHRHLLDGRAAVGAGVAAGGAEGVQARGAGLQQAQEHQRALAKQARQQQPQAGVCGHGGEGKRKAGQEPALVCSKSLSDSIGGGDERLY